MKPTFIALLALCSGCASLKSILGIPNWAERVGVYTYEQAVVDYGSPNHNNLFDLFGKHPNGTPRQANWIIGYGKSGDSWNGKKFDFIGSLLVQRWRNVMTLTFDKDGKLLSHSERREYH